MKYKLKKEKIKSFGFLLHAMLQKNRELNIPLNCFFIGAGCSKSSGIPLGGEVIDICRKLAFLRQHEDSLTIEKDQNESFEMYSARVNNFTEERRSEFENFVSARESEFHESITMKYIVQRIPGYLKEKISAETGLKNSELEDHLFNLFREDFFRDSLYGCWFESYSGDKRERQILIEDLIENKNPNGAFILFANFIQHGLIHNIFTTNFDDLLNEALMKYMDKKARVYSHNEMADFISITSTKPNIIKLHGDYLFENIQNLNDETSRLNPNMEIKMKEALGKLGLIVIGYNGADHSVMSVLEEIKIKNKKEFLLIWCAKNSDNLHWRVVNLLNETQNSFLVQIDDFDTLVGKLYVKFKKPINDIAENAREKKNDLDSFISKFRNEFILKEEATEEDKIEFDKLSEAEKYFDMAFSGTNDQKKIEFYSKAIELNPNYALAFHNRANVYNDLKEMNKALIDYNKAIALNPEYANSYNNRGTAYERLGETEKAIADYNKAIELNPNLTNAYNNRGIILDKLNINDKAILDYNKAIELNPSNAKAYINRGNFLFKMNEKEKAIIDYNNAIDLNPYYAEAYSNRGFVHEELDHLQEAIQDYSKAVEIDPKDSHTFNCRGNVYMKLNEIEKAKPDYLKAVELDPRNLSFCNSLLKLYLFNSEFDKAMNLIKKSEFTNGNNKEKANELAEYYFLKIVIMIILNEDHSETERDLREIIGTETFENLKLNKTKDLFMNTKTLNDDTKKYIFEKTGLLKNIFKN
ncbi:MAG: tetratricopeptide repeat protein [Ignavibacteria bacterium]|nr:tetratricopeptide repeat protein [Ignavibacteria bacterium]